MKDKSLFQERYKYVGEWVKLYSEFPEKMMFEILVQNKDGEYTFKHEHSDFTNYEDQTDFWFENKTQALECATARQLTADNLKARRFLSNAEYDNELERRMQINKKILLQTLNKSTKERNL
ncbi:MAG: hypothetical protein J5779_01890 [Clostridia bacterium]|nr:hypothetical protein [Clostridia bacterium]